MMWLNKTDIYLGYHDHHKVFLIDFVIFQWGVIV